MHNLKEIRKNFENFKNKLQNRNIEINIENLKKLDDVNRELIQKKEKLEQEKKSLSKSKDKISPVSQVPITAEPLVEIKIITSEMYIF